MVGISLPTGLKSHCVGGRAALVGGELHIAGLKAVNALEGWAAPLGAPRFLLTAALAPGGHSASLCPTANLGEASLIRLELDTHA